jgi:hypothetical protein
VDPRGFAEVNGTSLPWISAEQMREIDEQGSFFGALGAQGMPTTVFVGPGGQIADMWVGGLNADTLERLIGEHFGVAV